jgi:hypothetical protein
MLLLVHIITDYYTQELILPSIIICFAIYLTRYYLRKKRPVAYPGGPRPIGKYRLPSWEKRKRNNRSDTLEHGWYYLEGEESHTITHKRFGRSENIKLTGESAGRQTWQFDSSIPKKKKSSHHFDPSINPNSSDVIYRRQQLNRSNFDNIALPPPIPPISSTPEQLAAGEAAYIGASFYSKLQCDDGHWGGDYGGPMFLMPGIVIVAYVTESMDELLPAPHRRAMVLYLRNHQQSDGGWGTHIESPSTMFGTTLSYVTMRLLGIQSSDSDLIKARTFMHSHGGALYTSSWAKFWLSVLGVYDWKGINSIPPEMWLLPEWFPFHPCKMWCHSRMVYLPMGYIYGTRWVYPGANSANRANTEEENDNGTTVDPIVSELRNELYETNYLKIQWDKHRHDVADIDNYSPITWYMRFAHNILSFYESFGGIHRLRKRGLKFVIDYIHAEDIQTNYIDIGPVNKTMNMLSVYIDATRNNEDINQVSYFFCLLFLFFYFIFCFLLFATLFFKIKG